MMSSGILAKSAQNSIPSCFHDSVIVTPSPFAAEAGFRRPVHRGSSKKRRRSADCDAEPSTVFPAPLILPGDELAIDPQGPPQTLRSWEMGKHRNAVIPGKNTIYLASPPLIDPEINFIDTWTNLTSPESNCPGTSKELTPNPPDIKALMDYLSAFYHPLPVKAFSSPLTFAAWESAPPNSKAPPSTRKSGRKRKPSPSYIALRTSSELVRIRTRRSPDSIFSNQLNLDDLLDVAISILPNDAYALLLLVSHDIYESDDDIFTCGRAYGGSRVAVVSSARYNPLLDDIHHVDRVHAWPASHCKNYIEACCSVEMSPQPETQTKRKNTGSIGATLSAPILISSSPPPSPAPRSPLALAIHHHIASPPSSTLLYLIRIALTCAHELGHCFGLAHCVDYACCMQGSASLAEDARQPPYLCPFCEKKVIMATGADTEERMRRLRELCERWGWGSYGGWLEGRMVDMGRKG